MLANGLLRRRRRLAVLLVLKLLDILLVFPNLSSIGAGNPSKSFHGADDLFFVPLGSRNHVLEVAEITFVVVSDLSLHLAALSLHLAGDLAHLALNALHLPQVVGHTCHVSVHAANSPVNIAHSAIDGLNLAVAGTAASASPLEVSDIAFNSVLRIRDSPECLIVSPLFLLIPFSFIALRPQETAHVVLQPVHSVSHLHELATHGHDDG